MEGPTRVFAFPLLSLAGCVSARQHFSVSLWMWPLPGGGCGAMCKLRVCAQVSVYTVWGALRQVCVSHPHNSLLLD